MVSTMTIVYYSRSHSISIGMPRYLMKLNRISSHFRGDSGQFMKNWTATSFLSPFAKSSRHGTRNFHPDSMIGNGSFGSVCKGWVDENTFTATKWGTGLVITVNRLSPTSFQRCCE